MKLGISPINDFAFAKTFARPENKISLISLLNAILQLDQSIEDVAIVNPFNYKDFASDKLTILDVKATDTRGRIFNVEMQLTAHQGLIERIVYYGCKVYSDQLRKGDSFSVLNPVFTICILRGVLWKDSQRFRHRFRLTDEESGRVLSDTIEIHMLELGWYNLTEKDLAEATLAEQWVFWLLNAQEYEAKQLRRLFPDPGFQAATESLVEIHEKTEDKTMYDAQEKARRDHQWMLESSLAAGMAQGKAKGKAEAEIKGEIKLIHTLQTILEVAVTPSEELSELSIEELQKLTVGLQAKIQKR